MVDDVLYNINQIAVLLKVHPLTVRRYIKEGKLRAVKIAGNIRVPSSSIDAFAQNISPGFQTSKKYSKTTSPVIFTVDDALFRLKGRGISLKDLS